MPFVPLYLSFQALYREWITCWSTLEVSISPPMTLPSSKKSSKSSVEMSIALMVVSPNVSALQSFKRCLWRRKSLRSSTVRNSSSGFSTYLSGRPRKILVALKIVPQQMTQILKMEPHLPRSMSSVSILAQLCWQISSIATKYWTLLSETQKCCQR